MMKGSYFHNMNLTIKWILLLGLFLTTMSLSAQVKINYGFEAGISMPQIPWKNTSITETYVAKDQVLPFISPLLAFRISAELKRRFHLDGALQYHMTGERYHYQREGSFPHRGDLPVEHYYEWNEWQNYRFHKLAMPVTMTILFKKDRYVRPAVVIGYRANYFLSGSYDLFDTRVASNRTEIESYSLNHDPFDRNTMHTPLNRFYSQMVLGMSAMISSNWKLQLAGNLHPGLMYAERSGCWGGGEMELISGTDLTCTLTYFIKNKRIDARPF